MIIQESQRVGDVWREVQTWPLKSRVMLATRILQSVEDTIAGPALPTLPTLERQQALQALIGFIKTDHPPDDQEVEQILLEERLKKYG